jgi:hypothetical protein
LGDCFITCGCGAGGFKAIPGSGWAIAELMAKGEPELLAEPFNIWRFKGAQFIDEAVAAGVAHRCGLAEEHLCYHEFASAPTWPKCGAGEFPPVEFEQHRRSRHLRRVGWSTLCGVGTMSFADGNGKWILGGGALAAAVVGGWLLFGGTGEGDAADDDKEASVTESVPAAGAAAEDGDTEDDAEVEDENEAGEAPASN